MPRQLWVVGGEITTDEDRQYIRDVKHYNTDTDEFETVTAVPPWREGGVKGAKACIVGKVAFVLVRLKKPLIQFTLCLVKHVKLPTALDPSEWSAASVLRHPVASIAVAKVLNVNGYFEIFKQCVHQATN